MAETPVKSWRNHEREFRIYPDKFYKRSFRPDEYVANIHGEPIVPRQGIERLRNEAACLNYIRAHSNVPVPKVLQAYEEDGSFILVTELVTGRDIEDLPPQDQALVMKEVETHISSLDSLRSSRPGGPTGIMCPLPRMSPYFPPETIWSSSREGEASSAGAADFGFCHCDLGWSNIFIDAERPRIRAIVDWEYAGFWPKFFELAYYRDLRPTGAQFLDAPEWFRMRDFFASQL